MVGEMGLQAYLKILMTNCQLRTFSCAWILIFGMPVITAVAQTSFVWPRDQLEPEIGFETKLGKHYWIDQSADLQAFTTLGNLRGTGERLTVKLTNLPNNSQYFRIQELEPLISATQILSYESPTPDATVSYGAAPLQHGKLRLPSTPGPHPVILFIHGGCWLSAFDITYTGLLEEALTEEGFAVWSLEYRRVGDDGGGWPGTFLDIAEGADHLRVLETEYNLDLSRIIASGHSAGGHLALWLAGRAKIARDSALYQPDPLPIHAVVGFAPAPDLERLHESRTCGQVIDGLMGGSPDEFPERYANGSPMKLAPIPVMQRHILGLRDTSWAPIGRSYIDHARRQGDTQIEVILANESGHFEMITPTTSTWPLVSQAFRDTLAGLSNP